jgi:hypothetical protein
VARDPIGWAAGVAVWWRRWPVHGIGQAPTFSKLGAISTSPANLRPSAAAQKAIWPTFYRHMAHDGTSRCCYGAPRAQHASKGTMYRHNEGIYPTLPVPVLLPEPHARLMPQPDQRPSIKRHVAAALDTLVPRLALADDDAWSLPDARLWPLLKALRRALRGVCHVRVGHGYVMIHKDMEAIELRVLGPDATGTMVLCF